MPNAVLIRRVCAHVVGIALAVPALAQHWFQAPRVASEIQGYPIADVGDFDHDGAADLLGVTDVLGVTNAATRAYTNDGTSFFVGGASTALAAGEFTGLHVLADLDGDGELDLVTEQTNAVRIRRGLGNGAFDAGTELALPNHPNAVRAGQADADAALELGLSYQLVLPHHNIAYCVRWIDWRAGAFQLGDASTPAITNSGVYDIECVDENGDARDDLVFGCKGSLYTFHTGMSVLDAPEAVPPQVIASLSPSAALFLKAADFDADGTRELLVCQGTAGCVALEPQPGAAWLAGALQPATLASSRAYAGDWDGDGDLDLASNAGVASPGGLRLARNAGGTTFVDGAVVSATSPGFGAGLADLDLDGALDFAAPAELVYGNGTFDTVIGGSTHFDVWPTDLALVDLEGDGDLDQARYATWLVNDGSGDGTLVLNWPTAPAGFYYGPVGAYGDWDGDGRADWLSGFQKVISTPPFFEFQGLRLLRADAADDYVDAGAAADLTTSYALYSSSTLATAAFDVDQDGDLDVLRAFGYLRNTGSGYFDAFVNPLSLGDPLRVADFDGDGALDVVSLRTDSFPDELVSHELSAPGAFSYTVLATATSFVAQVAWDDFDGDGDRDVALSRQVSATTFEPLFVPYEAGAFGTPIALGQAGVPNHARLAAEDLDGDGRAELLAGSTDSTKVLVYPGTSQAFQFGAPRTFVVGKLLGFEDLDEDGDLDAVGFPSAENRRKHGAGAGGLLQYGAGSAGSGGAVPLLGASGPLVPGSTSATLNLVHAHGPAPTYLVIGSAQANVVDYPLAGLTLLIEQASLLAVLPLPASGVGAGNGAWHIPLGVDAGLAGTSAYAQAFVVDVGVVELVVQSNGLELRFGG